ncbi:MAG: lipocalin family protein [Cyclobacteriaceae bacterium]
MKKLFVFILFTSFFGCKQEDISNRAFLLSGESSRSWQIIAIIQDGKEGIPLDCQSDDVETFYDNSGYVYGHGSKSCSNQSNMDGTWTISEDFKSITISYHDESYFANTYQIIHLSDQKMVLGQNSFYSTQYTYKLVK